MSDTVAPTTAHRTYQARLPARMRVHIRTLDEICRDNQNPAGVDVRTLEARETITLGALNTPVALVLFEGDISLLRADAALISASHWGAWRTSGAGGSVLRVGGWKARIHNLFTRNRSDQMHLRPGYQSGFSFWVTFRAPGKNKDGSTPEAELRQMYHLALEKADSHGLANVVLAVAGVGTIGYSFREAFELALEAVRGYLNSHHLTNLRRIVFPMIDPADYATATEVLPVAPPAVPETPPPRGPSLVPPGAPARPQKPPTPPPVRRRGGHVRRLTLPTEEDDDVELTLGGVEVTVAMNSTEADPVASMFALGSDDEDADPVATMFALNVGDEDGDEDVDEDEDPLEPPPAELTVSISSLPALPVHAVSPVHSPTELVCLPDESSPVPEVAESICSTQMVPASSPGPEAQGEGIVPPPSSLADEEEMSELPPPALEVVVPAPPPPTNVVPPPLEDFPEPVIPSPITHVPANPSPTSVRSLPPHLIQIPRTEAQTELTDRPVSV